MLFLRLRSLGDVVLTLPAIEALHSWRPDLKLSVAVQPAYAPVFTAHPAIHSIFPVHGFPSASVGLARRGFAVVYNQHGGPTSAFLTAATLARVRVAWHNSQFPFLANVLVPGPEFFFGDRSVHTAEHRLTQLYWTGLPRGPVPHAHIHYKPACMILGRSLLTIHGIDPDQLYVVIQPGAAFATRRWPLDRFVSLAEWFAMHVGLVPVIVLGPAEASLHDQAERLFRPPAVVIHDLNLHGLIGLLARARLFIGHDTGPTHVAAALNCPVVGIFGSSNPVYWRPWGVPSRVVVNEIPCRPCPGDRCYQFDEPRCILSVTQEQVRTACRELLDETAAPKS